MTNDRERERESEEPCSDLQRGGGEVKEAGEKVGRQRGAAIIERIRWWRGRKRENRRYKMSSLGGEGKFGLSVLWNEVERANEVEIGRLG